MPQREPHGGWESDVPDGFEFLNENPLGPPGELASATRGSRHWTIVAAIGLVVLAVIASAWFLQSQPDPNSASAPPPATSSSPSSDPTPTTDPSSTPSPSQSPDTVGEASVVLGELDVKGRAPTTGYERERFGPDWADVDHNGCDTRNDVLKRDLTDISSDPDYPCEVETGVLRDPYSGDTIDFVRGWETSYAVQIDHVVALSNAWQTGAQYWKPRKRLAFANDPLNLLAVDGPLNLQKSDGDAATWLPPNKPYRCDYVARQIAVKAKYGLWLTAPERDAMSRILNACPDQALPDTSRP